MANLSTEEMALVTATQESLALAKDALRAVQQNMRKMAKINREAGRTTASNACMRLEGAALEALGRIIMAHAAASDSLDAAFDDGGVVITGGGGGR